MSYQFSHYAQQLGAAAQQPYAGPNQATMSYGAEQLAGSQHAAATSSWLPNQVPNASVDNFPQTWNSMGWSPQMHGLHAAALAQQALAGLQGYPVSSNTAYPPAQNTTQPAFPAAVNPQLACATLMNQLQAGAGQQPGLQEQLQLQMLTATQSMPPNILAMLLASGMAQGPWASQQPQQATSTSAHQPQVLLHSQEPPALADQQAALKHPPQPHTAVESGMVEPSPGISSDSDDDTTDSGQDAAAQAATPKQHSTCKDGSKQRKLPANDSAGVQQAARSTGPAPHTGPLPQQMPPPSNDAPCPSTSMPPPPPKPSTPDAATNTASAPQSYVQALLGPQQWAAVRSTLLKQQQTFVQQLFELHKLSQVQSLLCAELGITPQQLPSTSHTEPPPIKLPGADVLRSAKGQASGVWKVMAGANSTSSVPSVGTPAPIGVPSPTTALSPQQRVHQDLAHMANIPGRLRRKAGSASPERPTQPSGEGLLPALQVAARQRPGLLKPQPARLGCAAPDASMSQVSVSVGQPLVPGAATAQPNTVTAARSSGMTPTAEVATANQAMPAASRLPLPTPPPLSSVFTPQPGQDMMQAAASLLQQSGGLPTLPMLPPSQPMPPTMLDAAAALLHSAGSQPSLGGFPASLLPSSGSMPSMPSLAAAAYLQSSGGLPPPLPSMSTAHGKHSDGVTFRHTISDAQGGMGLAPTPSLPTIPPLMLGMPMATLSQGLGPPELSDPHAAWFSRHYGAHAAGLAGSGGTQLPDADMALGSAGAPGPAAGRWWHDETATFGDVTPSTMAAASLSGGTGQVSGKRAAPRGQNGNGNGKKARMVDEAAGAAGQGAFKAVKPKKARSQRGSNRLGASIATGPNRSVHHTPASSDSGLSYDSQDPGGSCFAGSVAGGGGGAAGGAGVGSASAARRSASRTLVTRRAPSTLDMDVQGAAADGGAEDCEHGGGFGGGSVVTGGEAGGSGGTGEDKSAAGILLSLSVGVPPVGVQGRSPPRAERSRGTSAAAPSPPARAQ